MIDDFVPTVEAARLLGCHQSWVRRLCADGRLRAAKSGGQWFIHRSCLLSGGDPGHEELVFPYTSVSEELWVDNFPRIRAAWAPRPLQNIAWGWGPAPYVA